MRVRRFDRSSPRIINPTATAANPIARPSGVAPVWASTRTGAPCTEAVVLCVAPATVADGVEGVTAADVVDGVTGALEEGALEDGALEDGAFEDGALEDGALDEGALEDGPLEDGPLEDGPLEDGPLLFDDSSTCADKYSPAFAAEIVAVVRAPIVTTSPVASLVDRRDIDRLSKEARHIVQRNLSPPELRRLAPRLDPHTSAG